VTPAKFKTEKLDKPVPVTSIRPCPTNPESRLEEDEELRRLAASMTDYGVLQNLVLRPFPKKTIYLEPGRLDGKDGFHLFDRRLSHEDNVLQSIWHDGFFSREKDGLKAIGEIEAGYEIVFGHRRFAAAKLAGMKGVPADVVKVDEATADELRLLENEQRKPFKPSERAKAFRRMIDAHGYDAAEVADSAKISVSNVRDFLALPRCPRDLLEAIDEGRVGYTTGALVARVPSQAQRELAARCVLAGCTDPAALSTRPLDRPPLSYRQVKELIAMHFQRELKGAPFKLTDKKLVPAAGSCNDCPKRVGNAKKTNPEDFEGTRDDICLDPVCYRGKVSAHLAIEREKSPTEASSNGRTPLPQFSTTGHGPDSSGSSRTAPTEPPRTGPSADPAEKPGRKQWFRVTGVRFAESQALGRVLQMSTPVTPEDIEETFLRHAREWLTFEYEEIDGPNGQPVKPEPEAAAEPAPKVVNGKLKGESIDELFVNAQDLDASFVVSKLANGTPKSPVKVKPARLGDKLYVCTGGIHAPEGKTWYMDRLYPVDRFVVLFPTEKRRNGPRAIPYGKGKEAEDKARDEYYFGTVVMVGNQEHVIGPRSDKRVLVQQKEQPQPRPGVAEWFANAPKAEASPASTNGHHANGNGSPADPPYAWDVTVHTACGEKTTTIVAPTEDKARKKAKVGFMESILFCKPLTRKQYEAMHGSRTVKTH
jgi:ParB/RepB/Spo0J family partition protein